MCGGHTAVRLERQVDRLTRQHGGRDLSHGPRAGGPRRPLRVTRDGPRLTRWQKTTARIQRQTSKEEERVARGVVQVRKEWGGSRKREKGIIGATDTGEETLDRASARGSGRGLGHYGGGGALLGDDIFHGRTPAHRGRQQRALLSGGPQTKAVA